MRVTKLLAGCLTMTIAFCWTFSGMAQGKVKPEQWSLKNGIRVVLLYIPESKNVSIFTFLPMGLTWDGAGKAQWSHLLEHLVIRSTHAAGVQEANAETLPDHMRLDFYGTVNNWKQGLGYHLKWLQGIPFTKEHLEREKVLVNSECDTTAANLATHKFAMAAWGQGYRHGLKHAAIKGDVNQATLDEIQKYRDEHLVILDKTVVCIVGGVESQIVTPVVEQQLGALQSRAKIPSPVQVTRQSREITWDLPTRHLIMTWPIPEVSEEDYAALYLTAALLQMRLFNDSALRSLTGQVLAGADLTTPEGHYLYINAVLQPGASFEKVSQAINQHLQALARKESLTQVPMFGKQLSYQLTNVMDPAMIKKQAPAHVSLAMIEGNIGLQWGMQEFRYGTQRTALAQKLATLQAKDIQQAIYKYLGNEKRCLLTVSPR